VVDAAADKGLGMGLNSFAFAFNTRGEEIGEVGREAVNCA